MSSHELEGIRRSAAMAPLSKDETERLIAACGQLIRERVQIAALLADLPPSFSAVRAALNELQRLIK